MASARISLLVCFAIIVLLNYQASALSIVSQSEFKLGANITVTCSASAVDFADNYDIYSVKLESQAYSSSNPNALNPKELIFSLDNLDLVLNGGNNYLKQNLLHQNWKFNFPSEQQLKDQKFDRNVVKGVLTITRATCQDAGHYICTIQYKVPDSDIETLEARQELNGTVVGSNLAVVVIPDNDLDDDREATYDNDTSIEVMCSAEGPDDYRFYWYRRCTQPNGPFPNRFDPYPILNDIKEHKMDSVSECGKFMHRQSLFFRMTTTMDKCMLRCDFGERAGLSDNLSTNFTFVLTAVTPGNGNSGSSTGSSSASNEDLIIGLVVSLLLVAIIVAAVLLYVFWWRKRKPKDHNYKDEPDVGNNTDAHAPPPVFYSKPQKKPKNDARGENDKWNSKDRNSSYDYNDDDDELPPKAYYYDNEEHNNRDRNEDPPRQKYSSNRPRSRRRSQRGSGDYYNYSGDDYPDNNSRNQSYEDGPTPYAMSTDFSRSEDESEPGRPRPKPKRRTKLPSSSSRDFEEPPPPKEKELHYADLDLSKKSPRGDGGYDDRAGDDPQRGRYNRNRRNRKSRGHEDEEAEENMPVQYASIRV